jgi:L-amino acid ligase C-terminal domain 2
LCARALRFVCDGRDEAIGLEELLLRHAVEMPVGGWTREATASGVMMIPVPASGVLEGVEGEAAARATANVTEVHITARMHDFIAAWPEGASYLGFLFARAATADEVETALRTAHRTLRFAIRERLAVEHPGTRRMVG